MALGAALPQPWPHLEDPAIRGAQEGNSVAILSSHRHSGQIQASALQHSRGREPVSAAQRVGQVL